MPWSSFLARARSFALTASATLSWVRLFLSSCVYLSLRLFAPAASCAARRSAHVRASCHFLSAASCLHSTTIEPATSFGGGVTVCCCEPLSGTWTCVVPPLPTSGFVCSLLPPVATST